jgi:capsular polysaccharide transport system permease protein
MTITPSNWDKTKNTTEFSEAAETSQEVSIPLESVAPIAEESAPLLRKERQAFRQMRLKEAELKKSRQALAKIRKAHAQSSLPEKMLTQISPGELAHKPLEGIGMNGGVPPGQPPLSELFPMDSENFAVQAPKKKKLLRSFLICVALPTFLSIVYFGILASDQYATSSQFIIHTRSLIPTGPSAMPGAGMTVVNPLALSDMLVVQDYVGSRQILDDLSPMLNLREIYSTRQADWFARLKPLPSLRRFLTGKVFTEGLMAPVSEEDLLDYWRKMASVKFDMTTGIATLQVKAFSAEESLRIAEAVLSFGENLVNQLSERSLEDALKFAKAEVNEAQARATRTLDDLQSFQSEAQEVDPEGYAVARGTLQAKLDADLSLYQSQLELLRKSLSENAPGIQQLKSKILVAQNQIQSERTKSTAKGTNASASQVLNEFAKKKLEVDFATQAYVSALEYLEAARASAMQQSRYLEAFVRPQLPDEGAYPKRLHAVLLTLLASLLLWGIGYLLVAAAKEHI